MTKKPVSNVGASVRQRLLNLRNQTGEDAQALFTQFAIERFLYRLSQSMVAEIIRQSITTTVEGDGIRFDAASIVDPINVQTMHEKGQRIESLHIRARGVTMQKNRDSRISNQPGQKRLGVKRSQVHVLSPRLTAKAVKTGLSRNLPTVGSAIRNRRNRYARIVTVGSSSSGGWSEPAAKRFKAR